MNRADPELIDRLAAAYALGTLRAGARRRFEAIARQSPGVRARVLLWQERLGTLVELHPATVPSPNVWKRIHNSIAVEAGPAVAPTRENAMLDRLRQQLRLWRSAAAGAALASLGAVFVGVQLDRSLDAQGVALAEATRTRDQLAQQAVALDTQLRARPEIRYVAVLEDPQNLPSVLVTFDPGKNTLTLKRVSPIREAPDRSLQLWALLPGGTPRSLGVLDTDTVMRLSAEESQVREAPALAISLEPKGGAPAGSGPTGPVLFQGALLQTPV